MNSATTNADEVVPLIPTTARDTRRPYEKQLAVLLILTSIFFQHAAFLTFENRMASSVKSNGTFNWTRHNSFTASYVFSGTDFISMLVFAVISDAVWGRAKTILMDYPIYLIGSLLMTTFASGAISICPADNYTQSTVFHERCAGFILPILIFTAIGASMVRANLIVFGIDQIQESKRTSRYIDKCIVAIQLGSIFTILITSYTSYHWDVPEHYFFTLYGTSTVMLFFSIILFIFGWPYYFHVKAYDSVFINSLPVIINAFRTWRRSKQDESYNRTRTNTHASFLEESDVSDNMTREDFERRTNFIDNKASTFLDHAKVMYNGKFNDRIVDDVKIFRNAILIFILIFPYRIIYTQFYTTFESQSDHMKQRENSIVNALLMVDEPIFVILGIFILNLFVYKYLRSQNRILTIGIKFIICMCFGCLTMCITGLVEVLRQKQCPTNTTDPEPISTFPILAKLPQDIIMSIAQLFSLLASFEFIVFIAPRSAQALSMSLYFCSVGVTSYVCDAYTSALSDNLIPLDFKCPTDGDLIWHYINYFFILAGIQLVFLIIFIICQKKIHMIRRYQDQFENR